MGPIQKKNVYLLTTAKKVQFISHSYLSELMKLSILVYKLRYGIELIKMIYMKD